MIPYQFRRTVEQVVRGMPIYKAAVNVLDYGADPTGKRDSTSAIQAAITAAGGKTVYLPPGTYKITDSLTGGTNGIRLAGSGRYDTWLRRTGAGNAITIPAANRGYVVEHMKISCDTATSNCIGITANYGHLTFRDLLLVPGAGSDGIDGSAGNAITVIMEEIRVEGVVGSEPAIGFNFNVSSAVNGLTFVNCYANACTVGYHIGGRVGAVLLTCAADNNTQVGFKLEPNVGRLTLLHCTAEGNDVAGFVVDGNNAADRIVIITPRTGGQLLPYSITGIGNTTLINPISTSTPSGNACEFGSGATGDNVLMFPNLDAATSINAAAKVMQVGTKSTVLETAMGWITSGTQGVTIGTLPAYSYVHSVRVHVTEAFDSDGTDTLSVGRVGDEDAFGAAVDVSTTGVKAVTLGAEAGYNATGVNVRGYYFNGGSEPTTGKALVVVEYYRVPVQP